MGPVLGRLFEACRRTESKRVVLLGLDNAGKTTTLLRLLTGRKIDTIPTIGFISEEIRHNKYSLIMWDIGGQSRIRKLWKHYVESADALIFVVDAQDRSRLKEARTAFRRMLRHKTLKDTVILVLANKSDYEDSMSVEELVEGLDIHRLIGSRPWHIQKSCAISGQGLGDGIDWLCRAMQTSASGGGGKRRAANGSGSSSSGEDLLSVSMSMGGSSSRQVEGGGAAGSQRVAPRETGAAAEDTWGAEKEQQ